MTRPKPFRILTAVNIAVACCGCKVELNLLTTDDDGDGYSEFAGDCDDVRADIYPGAVEICDDLDNDCDDQIDDADPSLDWSTAAAFYADSDGDGYGSPATWTESCFRVEGYVDNKADCDDDNAFIQPDAQEVCDDIDNDCDGKLDDDDDDTDPTTIRTWYRDLDQDGFGDLNDSIDSCNSPAGYTLDESDCDDSNANAYPGAVEVCDDIDNDCDILVDMDDPDLLNPSTWYLDVDSDGYGQTATAILDCNPIANHVTTPDDCDDTDASIWPGTDEICNGVDDDCDATVDEASAVDALVWYEDSDGDGYGDSTNTTLACSIPNGFVSDATDCDDSRATTYPGSLEYCNGIDDDCDTLVDDDDPDALDQSWFEDDDGDGYGNPSVEVVVCQQPSGHVNNDTDCDDTDPLKNPLSVWYRDQDGDGYGTTWNSWTGCDPASGYVSNSDDCNDNVAEWYPGVSWYADIDGDGFGDPSSTPLDCAPSASSDVMDNTDCDDTDDTIYPQAEEIRTDGIDQDCDGLDVVWAKISMGDQGTACALDTAGDLYCWGDDGYGMVSFTPTGGEYTDVSVGTIHVCAVNADGYLECWGNDDYDQCYEPNLTFENVGVHSGYSCGLRPSGKLFCWGESSHDLVDNVPSGTFDSFQARHSVACGQFVTGELDCWGPLADSTSLVDDTPAGVYLDYSVHDNHSIGRDVACAVGMSGTIHCWGEDEYVLADVPSSSFGPYDQVAVGGQNACAIETSGALHCWGSTSSLKNEPAGTFTAVEIGCTYQSDYGCDDACAIDTAGAIVCWPSPWSGSP